MKTPALISAILSFMVIGLVSCSDSRSTGDAPGSAESEEEKIPVHHVLAGLKIPEFSAQYMDGKPVSDEDFLGQWTVLEFWGLWCPDCMRDSPHVAALSRAINMDPELDFKTVHVDDRYGKWGSLEAYFEEKGYSYPVIMDADKHLYEAFKIEWVPSYLVIAPDGHVAGFRTDLSRETRSQGGVKSFLQDIAEIKSDYEHKSR